MPCDLFDWADASVAAAPAVGPDPVSTSQRSVRADRRHRGAVNHYSGRAAEDAVARAYSESGATVLARRWRGRAGEIDLILLDGSTYIFAEVKAGPTFDTALSRILPRQVARIERAATEFLAETPSGELSEVRLDAALVDGTGRVRIVANALGQV